MVGTPSTTCRDLPPSLAAIGASIAPVQPVEGERWKANGLKIRKLTIPKNGTLIALKTLPVDHFALVARGSIRLWKDGIAGEIFDSPTAVLIAADVTQAIESLASNTVLFCIHNTGN